jgi:hypothetical protein
VSVVKHADIRAALLDLGRCAEKKAKIRRASSCEVLEIGENRPCSVESLS